MQHASERQQVCKGFGRTTQREEVTWKTRKKWEAKCLLFLLLYFMDYIIYIKNLILKRFYESEWEGLNLIHQERDLWLSPTNTIMNLKVVYTAMIALQASRRSASQELVLYRYLMHLVLLYDTREICNIGK
jgi:hypothetical protein